MRVIESDVEHITRSSTTTINRSKSSYSVIRLPAPIDEVDDIANIRTSMLSLYRPPLIQLLLLMLLAVILPRIGELTATALVLLLHQIIPVVVVPMMIDGFPRRSWFMFCVPIMLLVMVTNAVLSRYFYHRMLQHTFLCIVNCVIMVFLLTYMIDSPRDAGPSAIRKSVVVTTVILIVMMSWGGLMMAYLWYKNEMPVTPLACVAILAPVKVALEWSNRKFEEWSGVDMPEPVRVSPTFMMLLLQRFVSVTPRTLYEKFITASALSFWELIICCVLLLKNRKTVWSKKDELSKIETRIMIELECEAVLNFIAPLFLYTVDRSPYMINDLWGETVSDTAVVTLSQLVPEFLVDLMIVSILCVARKSSISRNTGIITEMLMCLAMPSVMMLPLFI
jgi:hypothetical protein